MHGQGRQRDDRDPGEDAEHGDQHEVDRLGDVVVGVLGLLGHVRDRLDPGVGDHRDREAEQQLAEARRHPEVHLVDQQRRVEDQHGPQCDQQALGDQVRHGQEQVQLGRLADPADVQRRQAGDHDDTADDVPRAVVQRREERAQVVRHEEGADRDGDDVVERQRPAGEERGHLVEGVAGEGRGAAGLGEHGRALGIGLRGQREQAAGEDEHQRRQAQCVRGDEAERVVDRGPDVAVGRGEQSGDADGAAQALLTEPSHTDPR